MIAIIFEWQPIPERRDAYLEAAARLKPLVEARDGFISIERFESLAHPGTFVSISYRRDEAPEDSRAAHGSYAAEFRAGAGARRLQE